MICSLFVFPSDKRPQIINFLHENFNVENNIKPKSIFKEINSNIAQIYDIDYHEENLQKDIDIPPHKIGQEITKLRKEMKNMSKEMRFEEAARLRDKIKKLRKVELSLIGEIE